MVLTFKTSASCILQETQKNVTGTVRVKLFKGHAIVEGRKSEYSLYDEKLATYTAGTNLIMMQQLDSFHYLVYRRKYTAK